MDRKSAVAQQLGAQRRPTAAIDGARVETIAALIRDSGEWSTGGAAWDDPVFWNVESSRDDRIQFLAIGNAVNFRFWSLVNGRVVPATGHLEGEEFRGSLYLWRRLRLAISRNEFSLDARYLARLTSSLFLRAFEDDDGRCPMATGLQDRVANLRDLGGRLVNRWEGRFAHVVEASGGSLPSFARFSAAFRAFDDPVQKLTMVNAIMLVGSGLASFDEDPLPAIDYHLVKQAVRQGLVVPDPSIQAKLISNEFLEPEESLKLRRATLSALLHVSSRAGVSSALLDNLYWLNRRVCADETPACQQPEGPACPFETGCAQRTQFGLPLEITRYY